MISSMNSVQVTFVFPTLGDAAAALAKLNDARVSVEVVSASTKPETTKTEVTKPGKPSASAQAEKLSAAPADKPSAATTQAAASEPEKPAEKPVDLSEAVARAITERIVTPEGKAKTAKVLAQFKNPADGSPCKAGKHLHETDRAKFLEALTAAFETADDMT